MRFALAVILSPFVGGSACAQEPSPVRPVDAIPDIAGDGIIRSHDEKAMLDHYASQCRLSPESIVYIFAYSGRRACAGEAEARRSNMKQAPRLVATSTHEVSPPE